MKMLKTQKERKNSIIMTMSNKELTNAAKNTVANCLRSSSPKAITVSALIYIKNNY